MLAERHAATDMVAEESTDCDRDTSVNQKNLLDALIWLQDEVQSTEDCMCEMGEPKDKWAKVEASIDPAAMDVRRDFHV